MTQTDSGLPTGQLILVPALITLAVTILRFVGEIKQWSPNWFNHQMGLSVVAIVWLAPFFGVYFALRPRALGQQPVSAWGVHSDSVRQGLRRLQFVCLQGFPLPVQFGGIFANLFGGLTLLVPDTIISVI